MAKKEKIPLVYLCIHSRLCKNFGVGRTVKKKELNFIIGNTYHIPRKWWYPVIKEMIGFGLIEDEGRFTIKVLESQWDIDDTSMIYKSVGMF